MSIQKTTAGTWAVRWREDGVMKYKAFKKKTDAQNFVAYLNENPDFKSTKTTVAELFKDYRDRITSKKRGSREETLRINRFLERPFARLPLQKISLQDIQDYMDDRITEPSLKTGATISAGTLHKERNTLSAIFGYAVKRGMLRKNPCSGLALPKEPEHRERIASDEDIERLLIASGWDGTSVPRNETQLTCLCFLFACRTGMRSGELLRIEESWIEGRVLHIPQEVTKTDARRDIALSKDALRLLNLAREYADGEEQIFWCLTDKVRDQTFRRIRDNAGLGPVLDSKKRVIREGLNFHDSRATFCTWAASPNPKTGSPRLDVLALARQTGHKNLKMLQRYYRESAEKIALRLDE